MKPHDKQAGFSLLEVNMAVFVMAIGVLSMTVLYPLGLRESTQGQADLKQSMFADYVLNQAVAAAAQTNITWSQWSQWSSTHYLRGDTVNLEDSVPNFIRTKLELGGLPKMKENNTYKIACCLVPGTSDRIMGIMVQSTELTQSINSFSQFSNNPIFYAEVMFQGDPSK